MIEEPRPVARQDETLMDPTRPMPTMTRRSALRISFAATGAVTIARPDPGRAAYQASPTPDDGRIPSGVDGVPDAYTKLPTPYASVAAPPGNGGEVSTFQITFQPPIPGRDDNSY